MPPAPLRVVALAALAALLLPQRAGADDVDVAALVRDLDATEPGRRTLALSTLQRLKDRRALPLLVDLAPGFSLLGRSFAASVLDVYDEKDARPAFRRLVRGEDPFLRCAAGRALLRWGEPGAAAAIVEALAAPVEEPLVRLYMVNRLYGVDDASVRAALRALILPGADVSVLGAVLYVLQEDDGAETLAAVRRLLAEGDPDTKALAGAFLLAAGDEAGGPALAEALRTGAGTASLYRVRTALSRSGVVPPVVLAALTEALERTTDPNVLRALVDLAVQLDHAGALSQIQRLLDHESAVVAKAALEAVATLGGALDAERLRALLGSADADRRLLAADLLRRMDDASGFEAALEVLRAGTPPERTEAARIVGGFTRRAAGEALIEALLDAEVGVRQQALWALDGLLRNLFPYRRLDLVAAGYLPGGEEEERRVAVRAIRSWWDSHR